MKFLLSWLRQHLDTDADAAAIAERLTNLGLEVEGVSNPADALAPFRVARVLSAAPHPQADAQRTECRAHRLRLVMRPLRVIGGVAIEDVRLAGGDRGFTKRHFGSAAALGNTVGHDDPVAIAGERLLAHGHAASYTTSRLGFAT